METTSINETENKSQTVSENKSKASNKETAKQSAKMGATAAAGAAAGVFVNEIINDDSEPEQEVIAENQVTTEPTPVEEVEEIIPEPVTQTLPPEQDPSNGPQPVTVEDTVEPVTANEEELQASADLQSPVEEVDPDLIAQEIISGEEIDPEDIDADDLVDFAEVGTVYGADGQEYAAAVMTDDWGGEMVVIDVDNDGEFDLIADNYGNPVGEMPEHMSVSDAELAANDEMTYLAPTENDIPDVTDDILQDIIMS